MYVKIANNTVVKYPYTLREMSEENTNVCFPEQIPDEDLALFGVYRVYIPPIPVYDHITQRVEWATVPTLIDGTWTLGGDVVDKTDVQLDSDNRSQAKQIRNDRKVILRECDWTQGNDTPLSAAQVSAWAAYRQELRDISTQSGFPWNVVWPVAPTE